MFMNFWYPAEDSESVTNKPLKVNMLGLPFVLWRDEAGKAHCVSNTCSHRGGSIGDGKVVGNCVQCPYHGWLFNGDGECERIPSLGPIEKIPPRSPIDDYPVEERYGLIFVFLGDTPPTWSTCTGAWAWPVKTPITRCRSSRSTRRTGARAP
jgi:phenylpropionate dioxygenase-like ring-hydroxylating dioxygenase large terminal subunit